MKNLTAVMISFLRPEYTKECIKSLKKQYKDIKILVADNGKYNEDLYNFVKKYDGRYIVMPFDSGVCYARNRLVEIADTDFVLVGDDDFYYTRTAKVDRMLKFLEIHKRYSLIGGRVTEGGKLLNYQGKINIYKDHFHYIPAEESKNRKCKKSKLSFQTVDITFNYFVARRKDIIDVKWDEQIKVAYEHSDWFIMLKKAGGRKVAFSPEPIVVHKPKHIVLQKEAEEKYKRFRNRTSDMHYFFAKHKVDYSLGFHGMKIDFKDVKSKKRKYFAKMTMTYDGRNYNQGDVIVTDNPNELMEAVQ